MSDVNDWPQELLDRPWAEARASLVALIDLCYSGAGEAAVGLWEDGAA